MFDLFTFLEDNTPLFVLAHDGWGLTPFFKREVGVIPPESMSWFLSDSPMLST
jgi:hypothetical protein